MCVCMCICVCVCVYLYLSCVLHYSLSFTSPICNYSEIGML